MVNSQASQILLDIFDNCIAERLYRHDGGFVLKINSADELQSMLIAIETAIRALDKESGT